MKLIIMREGKVYRQNYCDKIFGSIELAASNETRSMITHHILSIKVISSNKETVNDDFFTCTKRLFPLTEKLSHKQKNTLQKRIMVNLPV